MGSNPTTRTNRISHAFSNPCPGASRQPQNTLFLTFVLGAAVVLPAQVPRPTHGKMCLLCHQSAPGTLRGNLDVLAIQNGTLQIKVDDTTEVLRYDKTAIKVLSKEKAENAEAALKAIKKGHEIRVEFTETAGVKTATLVSVKPPVEVAASERLSLEEIQKLVAQGPEKGNLIIGKTQPESPVFQFGKHQGLNTAERN